MPITFFIISVFVIDICLQNNADPNAGSEAICWLAPAPSINAVSTAHPNFMGKNLFVRKISYLGTMKAKNSDGPKAEPTKSELEILQVLWGNGPSTVRFVNDQLNEQKREVQYTSTLKLMQIMVEKGLLVRDESQMKHVYKPAADESKTKGLLLDRFIDSMYNGSASKLMMQLLGNKKTSKKEIAQIKELLKKMDKDQG
jgi:BlaI family penicillinase repressor